MTYHRIWNKSTATVATHGTETVEPSGAHGFSSVLVESLVTHRFLRFLCCVAFVFEGIALFVVFSVSCVLSVASVSMLFIPECPFDFPAIFIFY